MPAENSPCIIPPLVTPLTARDQLDESGLERLLHAVIEGGVAGVFILGTTGEAPSLSYRLRRQMIERTVAIVAGRVPVLVGVTDTAFVESVQLARFAADAGADSVVLTTPYYFPAGQTELTGYIRNIVPQLPLPVMLYNMPGLTKVWFEVDTLRQLADLPSVVGVKDSSGDLDYFAQVCQLKQARPDWRVLIGPEAMLAEAHAAGGDGGVSGGANFAPAVFTRWHAALLAGDEGAAHRQQAVVEQLQAIYDVGKYASRFIKATKSALSLLEICSDLPADPFHAFREPERQQVAMILRGAGVLD
ncbi:MAG: dihydrodipicolinate synthase family protein [Planctomycetaceae bacterium]|nr:dihydrodipicolinate synthase family protein [Planctomycetaceae bacterium]